MTLTLAIKAYLDSTWEDITSDVINTGVSAEWGMSSNKPTDFLAKTGQMRFSLKNNTGKYTPSGTSVISDDWKKGTKVKAVFTHNGEEWVRFYGTVDTIRIDAGTSGERKVHVTALDWMNHASRYPLNNPAVALDKRMDEAVTTILAGMPIQPLATEFDTGANTFPTIFNDATLKTRAYSEFSKLAISEFAPIYVKKDKNNGETLRVESANTRTIDTAVKQVVITAASQNVLDTSGNPILDQAGFNIVDQASTTQNIRVENTMSSMDVVYGESLVNRITTSANPTRIDAVESNLYTLDSPLYLVADEEKEFYVQFTESNSKRLVSALPPEDSYPTTLLHCDPSGTEELIVDESGKPFDDYDVQMVTNLKALGAGAAYLDGSTSYIEGTPSVDYELTGDFTVEWREYRVAATSGIATISRSGAGGFVPWQFGYSDGANSLVYITSSGASWDIANGVSFGAISLNTWTAYAISRIGNTYYMHKDGVLVNSFTSSSTILASTAPLVIGKTGSSYINAVVDEIRITKGLGRYTGNYDLATEPFTLSGLIYAAWTNRNGTGTEITEDFTVSIEYGAAGARVTVTNTGSTPGYLTTLKINGKIIETVSPVTDVQEDSDSITEFGYYELAINQPYQQDFVTGREKAAAILEANKQPKTEINKVGIYANRDEAHTAYFLNSDVGDLVEIEETQTETDASFYIQGMGWDAVPGDSGAVVNFWWNVRKLRDNISRLAVKFIGAGGISVSPAVNFGYLPAVSVESVPNRIWSLWFKADVWETIDYLVKSISGTTGTEWNGYFFLLTSTRRPTLFLQGGYTNKAHTFSALPNSTNWMHILIKFDASLESNVPRVFVNGTESALTSTGSEVVSVNKGEVGNELIVGQNVNHDGFTIKDFRIYNADEVISVQQLATALAAETPYGDANTRGLLFRAFNAPTKDIASYEGANLTEDQKLTDDIGGAVGTPINAPLGVAI